jgi:hypothetical protein
MQNESFSVAASPDAFMPLNEKQQGKLKQLTLCTLASHKKVSGPDATQMMTYPCCAVFCAAKCCEKTPLQILSYSQLLECLELDGVRALEDFIIQQCIYSDILKCKLDQVNACVHVQNVLQRDVRPEELPLLVAGFQDMCATLAPLPATKWQLDRKFDMQLRDLCSVQIVFSEFGNIFAGLEPFTVSASR